MPVDNAHTITIFKKVDLYYNARRQADNESKGLPENERQWVHGGLASSHASIWPDIAEYCGPDKLLDLVDLRG